VTSILCLIAAVTVVVPGVYLVRYGDVIGEKRADSGEAGASLEWGRSEET